jgi:hypothetical protein
LSSARRTASPPTGYSFGPRPPDHLLAAGLGSRRLTLHLPFPLRNRGRSAVSPAYPVGRRGPHSYPCRDSSGPSHHPCRDGAGAPAGRHTIVRDPFRVAGEGPGATPTPGPQLPIVIGSSGILTRGWRLRPWAPFSSSSDFLFLSPSSDYRESLGHSLSSGRPFYPFHPGLPRCPGFGATGGRHFPPLPPRERGDGFLHRPVGGSSRRTRGSPGAPPPSSGRPRRGGAAPAFVGAPNSSPSAPRAFAPGTGKP